MEAQHDLRSAVPSRSNVFSHVPRILFWIDGKSSRETEITDLQLTVRVHEQVSGLQVSVENVGGVDVFQTAEDLVDEGLEVCVGEGLTGSDDCCEIAFHEFCFYVRVCVCILDGRYLPS